MNIQCVLCKEIVDIGDFRTCARGIEITCSACGGTFEVEPRRPAAAPAQPAGVACPKCEAPVPETAPACPRCGLARGHFDGYEPEDAADAVDDAVVALWERCRADWQDASAHEAFLEAAVACGAFRYAAARYRGALRDRPGDPVARARLDEVARRAQAAVFAAAQAGRATNRDEPEPFRGVAILLVVLVALGGAGLVYALFLRGATEPRVVSPPRPVPMKLVPRGTPPK